MKDTTLHVRCPDCNRVLRPVQCGDSATEVVSRKCKCGQSWQLVCSFLKGIDGAKMHSLTWSRKA
jgi:uncharacterized protein with PIN domain